MKSILLAFLVLLVPTASAETCASETDAAQAAGDCYIGYVGTPVYEVCVMRDPPPGCAAYYTDMILDLITP